MKARSFAVAAAGGTLLLGSLALAGPAVAHNSYSSNGSTVRAELDPLNNSGVEGAARVTVHGRTILVQYYASGLLKNQPHAAHIHFGAQASHECPTVADDAEHDHRLNVAEGLPRYGPIVASLTTSGDTSPTSALAVNRFPTAPHGMIKYTRTLHVTSAVAAAVRQGKAVVVIHGLDYNGNGRYDFRGAGQSELRSTVPAEATDPASCGVLHRH